MLSRRHFLASAALGTAAATLPWAARPAHASVSRAQTLEQLAKASHACVVGTPVQSESRWETTGDHRRIITETRLIVDELVGGELEDPEVMVRTLGGQVGDIGQVVHGEAVLIRNHRAVVFLAGSDRTPYVTAMAQGHYPVRADSHGAVRLALSPRLGRLIGRNASSATVRLRDCELTTATGLITSAWTKVQNEGR